MQYIPCNSAQETLFLTQKGTFLPKDLQKKVGKSRQILIRDTMDENFKPKHTLSPNFSPGATRATSATLVQTKNNIPVM